MAKRNKDEEELRLRQEAVAYLPDDTQVLRDRVNQLVAQTPTEYSSRYGQMADAAMTRYANRPAFQYNAKNDPNYAAYAGEYTRLGRTAMEDTMARAAALTGGYGNSYAAMAGQNAYNSYMSALAAKVPELEQMAYQRYQNEGNDMLNLYELYANREAQDYNRYNDQLANNRQQISMLNNLYDDRYSQAYQLARDSIADARYADQTAYDRGIDERNYAYKLARDEIADKRYDTEWEHQLNRETYEDTIKDLETQNKALMLALDEFDGGKTGGSVYKVSRDDIDDINKSVLNYNDAVTDKDSEGQTAAFDNIVKKMKILEHEGASGEDLSFILTTLIPEGLIPKLKEKLGLL